MIKMKTPSLIIHVIVQNKRDLADKKSFFVYLEGARAIQRLRRILSARGNEKAMMYALTKGRLIDPGKVKSSGHLILTRNGVYWDLM
jgi:uncharacterized Zn finger protein